jgi:hypothetical protein
MIYAEGMEIQDHIKILQTQKSAVDNLSALEMSNETWREIIIQSIPPMPKWLLVILSLYAMSLLADIVSTLFAHGMIIGRDNWANTGSNSSNTVLAMQTIEECTNLDCKSKKNSTHITANCYWPGGGKEGQFLLNFGQKS